MSRRRLYQSNIHDLFYSLIIGELSALDKYISNGGSLKITGPDRKSLLIGCMEERLEGRVERLLELGVDVNAPDDTGMTPLMCAAKMGLSAQVESLLNHGADVDKTDKDGRTALIYAVMSCHHDILKIILQFGCTVNTSDEDGFTALHHASDGNDVEAVSLLISHDCDPCLRTETGHSVISLTLLNKNLKLMTMIMDHYGSHCEGAVFTPDLIIALKKWYPDAVIHLLSYGVNPFPDHESFSPWRDVMTNSSQRRLRTALISEYGYITSPGTDNNLLNHIYKNHMFIQCFALLKLLYMYGLQTDQADRQLTCKAKCLCKKIREDIQTSANNERPGSLLTISRTCIRRCLGFGVVKKALSLPLPNKLKRYICFSGEFCLEKSLI